MKQIEVTEKINDSIFEDEIYHYDQPDFLVGVQVDNSVGQCRGKFLRVGVRPAAAELVAVVGGVVNGHAHAATPLDVFKGGFQFL